MDRNSVYDVWLALAVGQSARLGLDILEHFGSAREAYAERRDFSALPIQIKRAMRDSIASSDKSLSEKIVESCARGHIDIITLADERYPQRLREIYDPPIVLYVNGVLPPLDDEIVISIVGTRKFTDYGRAAAESIAKGLASVGAVVVSGMASGIDTSAHKGALMGDGKTIAVLGSAIDKPYPRENTALYDFIAANGAVISEYAPGEQTFPSCFPHRNRIITGLSIGVVVVEAPARSGALISAKHAIEQDRDVFAVPGNIDSPESAGSNALIKAGAKMTTDALDILAEYVSVYPQRIKAASARKAAEKSDNSEQRAIIQIQSAMKKSEQLQVASRAENYQVTGGHALRKNSDKLISAIDKIIAEPPKSTEKKRKKPSSSAENIMKDLHLSPDERIIKIALKEKPMSADELVAAANLSIQEVSVALTMLEIKGQIRKIDGERFTI